MNVEMLIEVPLHGLNGLEAPQAIQQFDISTLQRSIHGGNSDNLSKTFSPRIPNIFLICETERPFTRQHLACVQPEGQTELRSPLS